MFACTSKGFPVLVSMCVRLCMCVGVPQQKVGTRVWRERVIISFSLFLVLSKSAHHRSEKVHFIWEWMSGSEGWVQGGGRQGWRDDPNKKKRGEWMA